MPTAKLIEAEPLVLVDCARIIELRGPAGTLFTAQYYDYADMYGIRVRIHYPDYSPYFNIILATYEVDTAAGGTIIEPDMLPRQNDEPLTINGIPIPPENAMVIFYQPAGGGGKKPPPPGDAKALVVCRHEKVGLPHHDVGLWADCNDIYNPAGPIETQFRIVPA